jgi:hypothetical protein
MKNLIIMTMCVIGLTVICGTSEAAKPKHSKFEVCNATCIDKWTKQWHDCNGIEVCERYAQHAGESCIQACSSEAK